MRLLEFSQPLYMTFSILDGRSSTKTIYGRVLQGGLRTSLSKLSTAIFMCICPTHRGVDCLPPTCTLTAERSGDARRHSVPHAMYVHTVPGMRVSGDEGSINDLASQISIGMHTCQVVPRGYRMAHAVAIAT